MEKVASSTSTVKKPAPASSVPLSHNQRDPFKSKVWEIKEGPSDPTGGTPMLTVTKSSAEATSAMEDRVAKEDVSKRPDASSPRKRHGHGAVVEGSVETLTYRDPFAGVYKK